MTLKERWRAFLTSALDPWTLFLLILTVMLAWAVVQWEDPRFVAVLTVMLSVTAGILGGLMMSRWNVVAEEGPTVTRGRVAVRSLKLLLANINALERRVSTYLERWQDPERKDRITDEVVETYLEEVVKNCGVLGEEALSSIENWTDIIPEADIRTQIGLLSSLKAERDELAGHLDNLRDELDAVKGESEEEAQELRAQISKRTEELRELNRKLREQVELPLGSVRWVNPRSWLDASVATGISAFSGGRTCRQCGFEEAPGTYGLDNRCPDCGEELRRIHTVDFPPSGDRS